MSYQFKSYHWCGLKHAVLQDSKRNFKQPKRVSCMLFISEICGVSIMLSKSSRPKKQNAQAGGRRKVLVGGTAAGMIPHGTEKAPGHPKSETCLIYVEPLWHDKRSSKSSGKTSSILFPRYNRTGFRSAAGLISCGFSVPCSGGGPSRNAEQHGGKKTHPPRFLRWPKARLALCCS